MKNWAQYRRLLLNRATLTRVLSEIELERIRETLPRSLAGADILVAGGGIASHGSETVMINGLNGQGNHVFADLNPARKPHLVADLAKPWPFEDGAFDFVLSTWVVEHLPNPGVYIGEAFRVLRGGGTLVCAVPFMYRKHASPHDYYRFTDTALSDLARRAGFESTQVQSVGGTPLVCCVSLAWPLLRVPLAGFLAFLLARTADNLLLWVSRILGRRGETMNSYPLSYILISKK